MSRSLLIVLLSTSCVFARESFSTPPASPNRPQILGIAHIAINVKDLEGARFFYKNWVGLEMPFSLKHPDGSEWIDYVKINDEQYIELSADSLQPDESWGHIAFYTNDIAGMSSYLKARGIRFVHEAHQGRTGDMFLSFTDADGHLIEIVEYRPGSMTDKGKAKEKAVGSKPDHIEHVAIPGNLTSTLKNFYSDILGFQEIPDHKQTHAWKMRVPDGADYVEFVPATVPWNQACEIVLSSGRSLCERRSAPQPSHSPVQKP